MSVERLATSGTNANKELYTPRPDVKCFLQPALEVETPNATGSTFTKSSRAFIDYDTNVKPKDRVTINGQKYNVSGMREHQYGTWPHKVVTLEAI
jgi:SPP1 family predicted phage head-tail adaptor